jgi:hypothetical protein
MIAPDRTLAYATISNCVIYVSSTVPPTDADWDHYLAFIKANFKPREKAKALVFERGRGLSLPQRQRLDESTEHLELAVAIISDSPVTRLVVNALSWVKRGYKAFSTSELDEAIRYLDATSAAFRLKEESKRLALELDASTPKMGAR